MVRAGSRLIQNTKNCFHEPNQQFITDTTCPQLKTEGKICLWGEQLSKATLKTKNPFDYLADAKTYTQKYNQIIYVCGGYWHKMSNTAKWDCCNRKSKQK